MKKFSGVCQGCPQIQQVRVHPSRCPRIFIRLERDSFPETAAALRLDRRYWRRAAPRYCRWQAAAFAGGLPRHIFGGAIPSPDSPVS